MKEQGDAQSARASFERALDLNPRFAPAANSLGLMHEEQGEGERAIALFRQAIGALPQFAEAHYNLGNALRRAGQAEAAIEAYRQTILINPGFALGHHNLGNMLFSARADHDGAMACYRKALELKPDLALAQEGSAHILLARGRWKEGFRAYGYRSLRPLPAPVGISGSPAQSADLEAALSRYHTLVLIGEQGVGDVLFFARFVPLLAARGVELIYWGDQRLAPMLARGCGLTRCYGMGETPPEELPRVPMGDLPGLLGLSEGDPLPPAPDLMPEPQRVQRMRETLERLGPAPYTAVTWRAGSKLIEHALYKEIPLDQLASALRFAPGTLISVQRLPKAGETDQLAAITGRPVHDLSAVNEDLEDMLALMSLADDYVSVSNTNVHLRASTGRSARILVPLPSEWRWMRDGESSPWYPGMQIFRQQRDGWQNALARLGNMLSESSANPGAA
jgi:lipoprotein NlpI